MVWGDDVAFRSTQPNGQLGLAVLSGAGLGGALGQVKLSTKLMRYQNILYDMVNLGIR